MKNSGHPLKRRVGGIDLSGSPPNFCNKKNKLLHRYDKANQAYYRGFSGLHTSWLNQTEHLTILSTGTQNQVLCSKPCLQNLPEPVSETQLILFKTCLPVSSDPPSKPFFSVFLEHVLQNPETSNSYITAMLSAS